MKRTAAFHRHSFLHRPCGGRGAAEHHPDLPESRVEGVRITADDGGYANTDTSLPSNDFPLRAQKQHLYEGGIRVPFIVRGPGVKAGSASHEPVAGCDLLPTLHDLAGGKTALPADIDGGSFRALLENAGAGRVKRALPGIVDHRPNHAPLPASTLRVGGFKFVVNCKTADRELYDLAKDIGEKQNLAEKRPEKVAEMSGILASYLKSVNAETYEAPTAAKKKKNTAKNKKAGVK